MKLGIKNEKDLLIQLLSRCKESDFKRLIRDVEPFITKEQDVNRVLFFEAYVKNALTA